jgi:hypothetical protein
MSTGLALDRLRTFRRRLWRDTVRRRLAEVPLLVPTAAAAGHAWGGWGPAAVTGGAMLVMLAASVAAEYVSLCGAFGPEHGVRTPPRWTALAAWAKSLPVVAGLAACGYLALGWSGAVGLAIVALAVFGMAARADWQIYRDAAATALTAPTPAQPQKAEPGAAPDPAA